MPWGALAGAAVGIAGDFLGGSNKPSQTTQTQQTIPPYLQAAEQQNLAQSQALANNQFTPYGGQLVANFSPDQIAGMQYLDANANNFQPLMGNAQGILGNAVGQMQSGTGYTPQQFNAQGVQSASFNPDQVNNYMSPYISNVLNSTNTQLNNQFAAQNMQNDDAAKMSGAFGGDRQAVADAMTKQLQGQTLANTDSNILNSGFQTAMGQAQNQFNTENAANLQAQMYNSQSGLLAQQLGNQSQLAGAQLGQNNLAQQLQAAGLQGNLATTNQGLVNNAGQSIFGVGNAQQQQQQNVLNSLYGQFQLQQQWPYQQQEFLNSVISGSAKPIGTTSSTTIPTNPVGQALGGGLMGLGLAQQFGNSGGSSANTGGLGGFSGADVSSLESDIAPGEFFGSPAGGFT